MEIIGRETNNNISTEHQSNEQQNVIILIYTLRT